MPEIGLSKALAYSNQVSRAELDLNWFYLVIKSVDTLDDQTLSMLLLLRSILLNEIFVLFLQNPQKHPSI